MLTARVWRRRTNLRCPAGILLESRDFGSVEVLLRPRSPSRQGRRLNGTAPTTPEWLATTKLIAATQALEAHRETALTADWHQREAFLRACGIPDRNMHLWHQAWNRTAGARADSVRNPRPSLRQAR